MGRSLGLRPPAIRLYAYITSPFAMKVHCYLLYKGVPFETYYVNPLKVRQQLPLGQQIPVLKVGNDARSDSFAIALWLEELFPDKPSAFIPRNPEVKPLVLSWDQWVTDTLIPVVFYSIYPQWNKHLGESVLNTLHLGYCVQQTTTEGLPGGLRFLWPFFIRNAGFIRRMVMPVKAQGSVSVVRRKLLEFLDKHLQVHWFLAETAVPSLADLSAWPQFVVPSRLGLRGLDDFKQYPNVMRWLNDVESHLEGIKGQPALIPDCLQLK